MEKSYCEPISTNIIDKESKVISDEYGNIFSIRTDDGTQRDTVRFMRNNSNIKDIQAEAKKLNSYYSAVATESRTQSCLSELPGVKESMIPTAMRLPSLRKRLRMMRRPLVTLCVLSIFSACLIFCGSILSLTHWDTCYYPHYTFWAALPPVLAVVLIVYTYLTTVVSEHDPVNSSYSLPNTNEDAQKSDLQRAIFLTKAQIILHAITLTSALLANLISILGAHCELAWQPVRMCDHLRQHILWSDSQVALYKPPLIAITALIFNIVGECMLIPVTIGLLMIAKLLVVRMHLEPIRVRACLAITEINAGKRRKREQEEERMAEYDCKNPERLKMKKTEKSDDVKGVLKELSSECLKSKILDKSTKHLLVSNVKAGDL